MIKIVGYRKEDKDGVIDLVSKTLFEIFGSKPKNIEDLDKIEEEYFQKNGIFYVAKENGKIVGTIAVKEESGRARLKRIYVDKDYRGKEVGQKLLNKIIEFSKRKGYRKIITSTSPKMKAGIEFYKKNGFKKIKKEKDRIFFELTF